MNLNKKIRYLWNFESTIPKQWSNFLLYGEDTSKCLKSPDATSTIFESPVSTTLSPSKSKSLKKTTL